MVIPNMTNELWDRDDIQFPRLISEIEGLGIFTDKVVSDLAIAMDLSTDEVAELIERASSQDQ